MTTMNEAAYRLALVLTAKVDSEGLLGKSGLETERVVGELMPEICRQAKCHGVPLRKFARAIDQYFEGIQAEILQRRARQDGSVIELANYRRRSFGRRAA